MLSAQNLRFNVGHKAIIQNITLDVNPGEIIGLIGANGAGKSTIMKILAGETLASSGEVVVDGVLTSDYNFNQLAKKRAFIAQDEMINVGMTALEIVLLGRIPYLNSAYQMEDYQIAYEMLAKVNAINLANQRYPSLSGGEKQRIQLARALCQIYDLGLSKQNTNAYLLLDEYSANMDLYHQQQSFQLLRRLAEENNLGILVIVHDLSIALNVLDRTILLSQGEMIASGASSEVLSSDNIESAFNLKTIRMHAENKEYETIMPLY
jgi:iron complex transport system ATP-binding protein